MSADEISAPMPGPEDPDDFDEIDEAAWADQEQDEQRGRTVRTIVALVVLIVIVIFVLLLLRTCSSTTMSGSGGEKTIVNVPTKVRSANVVSVWLKPKTSMRQVLASTGVRATSTKAMGEGLYFVFLPDRENAEIAVARLKADPRVNDAGFVYEQQRAEPVDSAP